MVAFGATRHSTRAELLRHSVAHLTRRRAGRDIGGYTFGHRRKGDGGPARRYVPAAPGKGAELAQAMKARCEVSRQDAGCEQFEVFQSVSEPDKLVLLELWKDQAALDAHAKLQAQRPPLAEGLRLGAGEREDYAYNRTR